VYRTADFWNLGTLKIIGQHAREYNPPSGN